MKLIQTPHEMKIWRNSLKDDVKYSVGFVPTMGALHAGHEELLKKSKAENKISVLSIFVNPTQFNDPTDFEKYPVTWDADLKIAQINNVDVVFAPTKELLYLDGYKFKLIENNFSRYLCGKDRPGHFDGVLTVVMKLFQVIQPNTAYFGEKDYQQFQLIKGMAEAFFMNVNVVPVPTVREKTGLAMSSRNLRLSEKNRSEVAPLIYKRITESKTAQEALEKLQMDGFKIDYVEDRNQRRFVAVQLNDVRLIDNVAL